MSGYKDVLLKRMFLYRMQYPCAAIISITLWYSVFVFFCYLEAFYSFSGIYHQECLLEAPLYIFALYNTSTYFYSKFLAKKYGIEMFADLDQQWLVEHQAFDSKAFGEIFARLIQCRKIAGPYMLAVIVPLAFINMYLATIGGLIYFVGYFFYRMTYLDTAVSYKIPRAFGGGGIVVSKIIDADFLKSIKPDETKSEKVR